MAQRLFLVVADADLVVRGTILTMEPGRPTAKSFAVGGGRILETGTAAQADRWRGRGTKVWTLKPAQIIVPGFVDSHAHLATDAWRRTWVQLDDCRSLEEALDRLRARTDKAREGEWIVGRGWDESTWPEKRYLTRSDLDLVSASRPILVNRVDGHMCSVNSVALRRFALTGNDPGLDLGPDGVPTGVLREEAAERARGGIPPPTDEEWAVLLERSIEHAHSLGITAVHDVVDERHLRAYQALRRQGRLSIRAYLMPYDDMLDALLASGMQTGFGDAWLRLGPIKVFADGSLGARTAALSSPYEDDPKGKGRLNRSPKELVALLTKAHRSGFQLAVHAIGDLGIDVVVEAIARALDREPREDHRHRIEHFELPSDDALDRMEELGLIASMQPNFVARWSHPGGLYERRLGRERNRENNPYRQVLDRGIPLAFGSDGMPYGPLYGIDGALNAPFPSQRMAPDEALRCYTANGAFAAFAMSDVGVLAAGMLADFVVLSADPRRPGLWPRLSVDVTVVGGRVVYDRGTIGDRIRGSLRK